MVLVLPLMDQLLITSTIMQRPDIAEILANFCTISFLSNGPELG